MNLKLETSAGDVIGECFNKAKKISIILDIIVEFQFNGVTCLVGSKGDESEFVNKYNQALNSKSPYKFAVS